VSLLFISNVLEPFEAIDDSGDPIPFAVLTFWQSRTVEPQAVYEDQDATVPLSGADGRVVADQYGVFPTIYLHPTNLYRVKLETADGVLRWDVDPYLCDCTEPPRVFRNPRHQALTKIADEPLPEFASPTVPDHAIRVTLPGVDTPTPFYSDSDRRVALPNPVRSNAGGMFPPIYLDDAVEVRVRIEDADGEVVLDLDPYECQCGFLILTSNLYPFEWTDTAGGVGLTDFGGVFDPVFGDSAIGAGGALLSGTMVEPIVEYNFWPADSAIGVGGAMLSGNMIAPIIEYNFWPADSAIGVGGAMLSGNMIAPIIEYDQWPVDAAIGVGGSINSGTMSLS
jgi:hypothetical protein